MSLNQENLAVASAALPPAHDDDGDHAMEAAEQGAGALAFENNDQYENEEEIYNMMDNLQQHQRTNAALIGAVHEEQQRAYMLKKGILGLVIFAIVLSLSNMTTTLVAARLFQQKSVGIAQGAETSDLVDPTSHTRLGTTTKMVGFSMNPPPLSFLDMTAEGAVAGADDHAARRRLQQAQSLVCSDAGNSSDHRACQIQGEMHFSDAVKLYQEFCPSWPHVGGCSDGGVVSSLLTCNGKNSQLYGGIRLPTGDPTLGTDDNGNDYVLFPTAERGYEGIQQVLEPDGTTTCSQSFRTGIFCFYDDSQPCYVFSSWEPGQCEGAVQLCGNAPANSE